MDGFDGNLDQTCENCRFFSLNYDERSGDCRRYAPRPRNVLDSEKHHVVDTYFVQMGLDDWCGEFQPHPQSPDQRKAFRESLKRLAAEAAGRIQSGEASTK
jgi:hypothetical protein